MALHSEVNMKKIIALILFSLFLPSVCIAGFGYGRVVTGQIASSGGACTPLTIAIADGAALGSGGATSLTPDLGEAPSTGNLLILILSTATANDTVGTPSGWTLAQSYTGDTLTGYVFYKTSDGTEQTVTVSWTGTEVCMAGYFSFSGFASAVLDASVDDETYVGTATQEISSGTTGTLSTECCYALTIFIAEIADNISTGTVSFSNSFTSLGYSGASSSRPGIRVASKTLESTSAVECTMTTTDTGDEMYGAMLVFKE